MKFFTTNSAKQTQKLGEVLAQELHGGEIIALRGELGSGKTTFAQGLLKGLKVKGPYTSPTFVVLKEYKAGIRNKELGIRKKKNKALIHNSKFIIHVFHVDAYRVTAKDILNLGWEEIIVDPKNIVIVEWADRIKKIIPARAVWIKFEWIDKNKRKLAFN